MFYVYMYIYVLETLIRKGRLIQSSKSQREISCLSTFSDALIEYLSLVIYKEEKDSSNSCGVYEEEPCLVKV